MQVVDEVVNVHKVVKEDNMEYVETIEFKEFIEFKDAEEVILTSACNGGSGCVD